MNRTKRPCRPVHAFPPLPHKGNTCAAVVAMLRKEDIVTTRQTVWRLERHVRIRGTIEPRPKSGRPSKLTATDIHAIDDAMEGDDETTGKQCLCSIETECPCRSIPCIELERRLCEELRTANLFVHQIEPEKMWDHPLNTSYGQTRQPCSWRSTAGFAAVRKGKSPGTNPAQSIL